MIVHSDQQKESDMALRPIPTLSLLKRREH